MPVTPVLNRALPYWLRCEPDPAFDIRLLQPPTLPKGKRFETERDAEVEAANTVALLQGGSTDDVSLAGRIWPPELDRPDPDYLRPASPVAARRYRIWRVGEELKVFSRYRPVFLVTLLFVDDIVPQGRLHALDLGLLRRRLRAQMSRQFGPAALVAGSFEVAAKLGERVWVPHIHLMVAGVTRNEIEGLRRNYSTANGMQVKLVKNLVRTINYTGKWSTGHRPLDQDGPERSPQFRLPLHPHNELLHFYDRVGFQNSQFLYGIRREGSRLVVARRG